MNSDSVVVQASTTSHSAHRPDRLSPTWAWQHYFDSNGRNAYEDLELRLQSYGVALHPDFPVLEDRFCRSFVAARLMRSLRAEFKRNPQTFAVSDLNAHLPHHLRSIGFAGFPKPQGIWQRARFAFLFWNRSFGG